MEKKKIKIDVTFTELNSIVEALDESLNNATNEHLQFVLRLRQLLKDSRPTLWKEVLSCEEDLEFLGGARRNFRLMVPSLAKCKTRDQIEHVIQRTDVPLNSKRVIMTWVEAIFSNRKIRFR